MLGNMIIIADWRSFGMRTVRGTKIQRKMKILTTRFSLLLQITTISNAKNCLKRKLLIQKKGKLRLSCKFKEKTFK